MLHSIFTGYPRFKLGDEQGIPREKIRSFPWLQMPYMARMKFGLRGERLEREWAWWAHETLDAYASRHLADSNALIALSGSGLKSGRMMKRKGGIYICDRGSSHIRYQQELLREEYQRWGLVFRGVDARILKKEESEYEEADGVAVPSEFVKRSFIEMGVPEEKLHKVPYGIDLKRFQKVADTSKDEFNVIFVGQGSLRKGLLYLLDAFRRLRHPRKSLTVIGSLHPEVLQSLNTQSLDHVKFLGNVSNVKLPMHYSRAHVFVLPSIEEGFGMVMGEAMACGCPVIATSNTGARDLFQDGQEGFIVPAGDASQIALKLQVLMEDADLHSRMSQAAASRPRVLRGWDVYGEEMKAVLHSYRL